MKILMIEDDTELYSIVRNYFEEKSGGTASVDCAYDGESALMLYGKERYDAVLLDVMLPDTEGFEICRELRRISDIPVIFLTARHMEEDVLRGYRAGCDDYISKPFSLAQLYAKLNAVFRRSNGSVQSDIVTAGGISMNTCTYSVMANGAEARLTPKEYAVLKLLLIQKNNTVSRETILTHVWGCFYEGSDRVVDNTIRKLRKSLGNAGKQIKTVISIGYRLEDKT